MRRLPKGAAASLSLLLALGGTAATDHAAAAATVNVSEILVDPAMAGDVKMLADIDGDGLLDPMVGGGPDEALTWYRFPSLEAYRIAPPLVQFTTDGEAADVDGDGDPDVVVPDGNGTDNLVWLENPRPAADPAIGEAWTRRVIGTIGDWGKDVETADYDGDGRMDVAIRGKTAVLAFFQRAPGTWRKVRLATIANGEGMARGDVDMDGQVDLVVQGAWLRNPGGSRAWTASAWKSYPIGTAPQNLKALVADIDGDRRPEVIYSSSENTANITIWSRTAGNNMAGWSPRVAMSNVERAHTLQAGDMDGDGDTDLVVGQMHTSALKRIMVLENLDGIGLQWQVQQIGEGGLHDGIVADIDRDGDPDLFGANWTGNPPVRLWLNER
ncbi:MAG: VCBS repeat-containing protein [Geminicoccaceae bacterium]